MKRLIALVLMLVLCLSLCACGKNEAVQNAEKQIAVLENDNSYRSIYLAYKCFESLNDKEAAEVSNVDLLKKYCDITNGNLLIQDEMIKDIVAKYDVSDPKTVFSDNIEAEISAFAVAKGLAKQTAEPGSYYTVEWVSNGKPDDYSYDFVGKIRFIQDDTATETTDEQVTEDTAEDAAAETAEDTEKKEEKKEKQLEYTITISFGAIYGVALEGDNAYIIAEHVKIS